jgi:hypothetical protein
MLRIADGDKEPLESDTDFDSSMAITVNDMFTAPGCAREDSVATSAAPHGPPDKGERDIRVERHKYTY